MAVPVIRTVGRPLNALKPMTAWAVEVGEWVQDWLGGNDKNATGRSSGSLEVTVTKPNEVVLSGADSLKYALAGRRAGKFPPMQAIEDWIVAKGIVPSPDDRGFIPSLRSLAFLIGRKIADSGTNEPKLRAQNLTLVINQKGLKYLDQMGEIQAKEASEAMVKLLTKDIPNTTEK